MKKKFLLLFVSVIFYSCQKQSISPNINIFPEQTANKYYPTKLTWVCVEGDTLFKDTLIMTYPYPYLEITENATAIYNFNYPIWQSNLYVFWGKLEYYEKLTFSNRDQTKSVTFKRLS